MEGYDAPPESYLPPIEPVTEIDEEIIAQMRLMGFLHSHVRLLPPFLSEDLTHNAICRRTRHRSSYRLTEHSSS